MPTINGQKAGTGGGGGGGGSGTVTSADAADGSITRTGTASINPRFAVTLATVAPLAIGTAAVGTSLLSARQDHVHAHGNQLGGTLHANADGSNAGFLTSADFTKLAGIAASAAALTAVAPLAIGTQAVGVSTTAARGDHVHAHGNQLGGTLHANADGSNAGFLTSADFTKLAGIAASAAALTANAPQAVGTAAALGTGTAAAKDDHVHAHGNQTVDTLHALVVAATSHGFMDKADKTRLDAMGTASPPGTRTVTGTSGLSGGGDLSANRTITLDLTAADVWTAAHTWTTTTVPITSTITDGSAATQLEAARFRHTSSVNGSGGIASYTGWWSTNGSGTAVETSRITSVQSVVTAGSERGVHVVSAMSAGTMTPMQWVVLGQTYTSTSFNIGGLTLSSGVVTNTAIISISGTNVNYSSASAAQGGHSFTGTVNTSGARSFFVITPSANTATTLSTAVKGFDYQTYTRQWATGAGPAEQAEFVISAPTYTAVAASTFPIATTFQITGAPIAGTNMTITKPLSFHVLAGGSQFDGNVGFYGVSPAAQGTGGQNVTNNVTNSSSVDGTIPDITDGTVYGNDYANLRKALYQIARMLKQDHDQLRANGFLT